MNFLSPPLFMNKEVMAEVAQLNQFDDELYKVTGKVSAPCMCSTSSATAPLCFGVGMHPP